MRYYSFTGSGAMFTDAVACKKAMAIAEEQRILELKKKFLNTFAESQWYHGSTVVPTEAFNNMLEFQVAVNKLAADISTPLEFMVLTAVGPENVRIRSKKPSRTFKPLDS